MAEGKCAGTVCLTVITPDDLVAAERAEAVAAGDGDILFIRNGAGAANTYEPGTGLQPDCLAWLHERRIAVVSSDSDSDVASAAARIPALERARPHDRHSLSGSADPR